MFSRLVIVFIISIKVILTEALVIVSKYKFQRFFVLALNAEPL